VQVGRFPLLLIGEVEARQPRTAGDDVDECVCRAADEGSGLLLGGRMEEHFNAWIVRAFGQKRTGEVPLRVGIQGENALAAFATARWLGIEDITAAEAISSVQVVPGRVESVEVGQGFLVLVDYAHTPDSVENVLRAARSLTGGRLIVVLGAGGDRDRVKRPLMGRAATANADLAVITSDNPRSEDPLEIIAEITRGAERGAEEGGGRFVVEPDRRAAIRLALQEASHGDVVVVAGKGHETYQELADRRIPFDDRAVAEDELRSIGKATRPLETAP